MEDAGPLAFFRHDHLFEPVGAGTRMTDVIEFRTRCGPVAPLVDLAAGAYLRRLMTLCNATIRSRTAIR